MVWKFSERKLPLASFRWTKIGLEQYRAASLSFTSWLLLLYCPFPLWPFWLPISSLLVHFGMTLSPIYFTWFWCFLLQPDSARDNGDYRIEMNDCEINYIWLIAYHGICITFKFDMNNKRQNAFRRKCITISCFKNVLGRYETCICNRFLMCVIILSCVTWKLVRHIWKHLLSITYLIFSKFFYWLCLSVMVLSDMERNFQLSPLPLLINWRKDLVGSLDDESTCLSLVLLSIWIRGEGDHIPQYAYSSRYVKCDSKILMNLRKIWKAHEKQSMISVWMPTIRLFHFNRNIIHVT